jgi:hypothetical protein
MEWIEKPVQVSEKTICPVVRHGVYLFSVENARILSTVRRWVSQPLNEPGCSGEDRGFQSGRMAVTTISSW